MSHQACLERRQSGVLLHITSLPGPFQQGVLGEEALHFIDRLVESGYHVWQFLPLGPTHGHGSPYESLCSSAGNPKLIDLRYCVQQNWLAESTLTAVLQAELLPEQACAQASSSFWSDMESNETLRQRVEAFQAQNKTWLHDYALFTSLKIAHADMPWWQWPEKLRDRQEEALEEASRTLIAHIQQVIFEQFIFNEQWQIIKTYAEERGVQLFGDLPIYVAHDSSDVWVNRNFFTVNAAGLCDEVAGVPPDYFSTTGQRWGNPLYQWDQLEASDFSWWIERVDVQMQRMHMLRIDHFRGLEAYWAIPGDREDGIEGQWRKAPGAALLQALQKNFGKLPIIAEDLGMITQEVHDLRQSFSLPGMKILQFAFGGGADNAYLPHAHSQDMVCYTGTHDNDTTVGWWQQASQHEQQHVSDYFDTDTSSIAWLLIRATLASTANLAIIPMQDLLELDSAARFNTPGTVKNNWSWRLQTLPEATHSCWQRSMRLNRLFHRTDT